MFFRSANQTTVLISKGAAFLLCVLSASIGLAVAAERKTGSDASVPWAFRPILQAEIPKDPTGEPVHPIDAFLLKSLREQGLSPTAEADRRTLIRRLSFDLIGLPPTPEEVDAFVLDSRPDAYELLVDRLLADPHYGERWGRHWLDLVRFAETNGYERDDPKPNVWRYRDYVIRAFNEDKPYDRFLLEQLAGDEIADSTEETKIATGLHRLGLYDDEPADRLTDRFDRLDDTIKTVATTMLGLTVHCARCHDHKFDPISQADYYRFLSLFAPSRSSEVPLASPSERKRLEELIAGTKRRIEEARAESKAIRDAAKPTILARELRRLDDATLAAFAVPAEERSEAQKKLIRQAEPRLKVPARRLEAALSPADRERLARSQARIDRLNATRPSPLPSAPAITDKQGPIEPTFIMIRGDARKPGQEVQPGFLSAVPIPSPTIAPLKGRGTTGRRSALARWMIDPRNPLTARVLVNRLWQHHFGQGIVATPSDFGAMGEEPSHPELLDWLAGEFVRRGWSIKSMHKLMVTSAAYRRSIAWNEKAGEADPGNTLLWRMVPRRLEAEPARDAALFVDGSLDVKIGGPSVFPPIDASVLATQSRPGNGWGAGDESASNRRSIYVYVKRTLPLPELEVLDAADNSEPCPRRAVTTTAPQALNLLNGRFWNRRAEIFAARLLKEEGPHPSRQVDRAFRLAFGRKPSEAERKFSLEFLASEQRRRRRGGKESDRVESATAALSAFCLVILNANEFVTID